MRAGFGGGQSCVPRVRWHLQEPETTGTPGGIARAAPRPGVPGRPAPRERIPDPQFATLEWVDWFNNRRLLGPIGDIPPAEFEALYYAHNEAPALMAGLT
jgi:transposase InsO family protein